MTKTALQQLIERMEVRYADAIHFRNLANVHGDTKESEIHSSLMHELEVIAGLAKSLLLTEKQQMEDAYNAGLKAAQGPEI